MSEKMKVTYYPGCSSEATGRHLDESIRAVMPEVGVEMADIEDWNCCGASVGHIGGGPLPTLALSGRNLANAKKQGNEHVMTPCAACYLNTHGSNLTIRDDKAKREKVNEALKAGGMEAYEGDLKVHHAMEVLVNFVGMEKIAERATNKLKGLKVAGWVGCQTVRPFAETDDGGEYDTYEEPEFLDDITRACGAEAVPYEKKTNCCGGSVAVMKPEKTLHLMKLLLEEAEKAGADVISTPCPLCQTNLEMYQDAINAKYGTNFHIPVVFPSQLMAVAFGMDAQKDAALQRNTIRAEKLEKLAKK